MKKVVIDTSVAIKWFFPEKGFKKALDLKEKHLKNEIFIYSRDLFLYEFISVFKNYPSPKIEEKDFSVALSALISLKIKFLPLRFDELNDLFSLSRKLDISIYDGAFILLAKNLKAPFFTSDKKLFEKSKNFIKTLLI